MKFLFVAGFAYVALTGRLYAAAAVHQKRAIMLTIHLSIDCRRDFSLSVDLMNNLGWHRSTRKGGNKC